MEVDVVVSGSKAIEISFETKVIGSLKTPDPALSTTSENPVQNKVITEELNKKVNKTDIATINGQPLTEGGNIVIEGGGGSYDDTELKEQVADLADAVTLQSTKTSLNEAEIGQLKASKADKEGYYSSLVAGAAENLINTSGDGVVRELTYDTAGGTADIGTGTAIIKRMRGKSLVWNQLLAGTPSDYAKQFFSPKGDNLTLEVIALPESIWAAFTNTKIRCVAGHKYAVLFKVLSGDYSETNTRVIINDYTIYPNTEVIVSFTQTAEATPSLRTAECLGMVFRIQVFDLTQMFGAGNEPATIEEFKRLFPRDDYAYNSGEVIHFNGRRLLTTGFNQWDEQWELGGVSGDTGEKYDSSTRIRTRNYIPIVGGATYHIHIGSLANGATAGTMCWYDAGHKFIEGVPIYAHKEYTAPASARYCLIGFYTSYGTTYNNDICINLSWSGYRNGEYEPYEEHILELPYGVYGDGLKSAGTAYDEVTEERYVKRIGVVDMGTLNWTKASSGSVFYTTINDLKWVTESKLGFSGNYSKMLCSKYVPIGTQSLSSALETDKSLSSNSIQEKRVQISDTSYTDAASFKAAMSGVMLYYELAEPIVTEFETPLNLGYYVNDFGTEMILPENGIAPFTAPAVFDILYAMNAVDTLRNLPTNYISKESFDNFTAALSSALANAGITMSIRATFNEETGAYTYTITASKTE